MYLYVYVGRNKEINKAGKEEGKRQIKQKKLNREREEGRERGK
jgi:hypothetical protein